MNYGIPMVALAFDISEFADSVVGGALSMLKDSCFSVTNIICGTGTAQGANNTLAASTMSSVTATITNTIKTSVIPSLETVGLAIALLFFIIALIELTNQDRLTMEIFVKFFAKLGIAVFAVTMCDEIFDFSLKFGDALATQLSNVFSGNVFTVPDNLGQIINDQYPNMWKKIGACLSMMVTMAPCYILAFAIQILVYIISFSRLIELCARGCFLPIATGLLADDGWKGAGGRYIKKFIAVCAQAAMLVVVAGITGVIMSQIGGTVISQLTTGGGISFGKLSGSIGLMCGVGIAMVSCMFKCAGIVNDVFGA